MKANTVIMNPPYSMKYDRKSEALQNDPRFKGWPMAPASKADYMFLLDALDRLEEQGSLAILLPHGVLFRGSHEEKIRRQLIQQNLLDAVIGLPDKLFTNTDIPTVILLLKKDRKAKDILFIDASEHFEREGKKNYLSAKHLEEIMAAVTLRKDIERYAAVHTVEQVEENDYNLNIPRYVDTYVPPPPIDVIKNVEELLEIEHEIRSTTAELYQMMRELEIADASENVSEDEKKLQAVRETFKILAAGPPEGYGKALEAVVPAKVSRKLEKDGLPSKTLQMSFVDLMDGIEKAERGMEGQIENMKEVKKWMLDKMFC